MLGLIICVLLLCSLPHDEVLVLPHEVLVNLLMPPPCLHSVAAHMGMAGPCQAKEVEAALPLRVHIVVAHSHHTARTLVKFVGHGGPYSKGEKARCLPDCGMPCVRVWCGWSGFELVMRGVLCCVRGCLWGGCKI